MNNAQMEWLEELALEVEGRYAGHPAKSEGVCFAYCDAASVIRRRAIERMHIEQCNPPMRTRSKSRSAWRDVPRKMWALVARSERW